MLDSVLFELSNINQVINIGQETTQHLLRDLMFVVSIKIIQTEYYFAEKYKHLPVFWINFIFCK